MSIRILQIPTHEKEKGHSKNEFDNGLALPPREGSRFVWDLTNRYLRRDGEEDGVEEGPPGDYEEDDEPWR